MVSGQDSSLLQRLRDADTLQGPLLVLSVAIITVAATAAPAYVMFSGSQESPTQEESTSPPQGLLEPSSQDTRLPDSALLRHLGLPATGEPLEGPTLTEALEDVEATPDQLPPGPGLVLDLAAQDARLDAGPLPGTEASESLHNAANNLATSIGEAPLTNEEQAHLERVPASLVEPLTQLIDALTLATQLQQEATEDLSPDERGYLLKHAPKLATGQADEATQERVEELASRVDLEKSVAASRVLVNALEDARGPLEDAASALEEEKVRELNAKHTAPQSDLPPRESVPTSPQRDDVLEDTAEMIRSRTHLTHPPTPTPATPLDEALPALATTLGANLSPQTLTAAQNLPPELSGALGRIVQAYADTITLTDDGPTAAEGAATVLEAIEASRPTLERWSWMLDQAPPITRPLTDQRATHKALNTATDTLDLAASPTPATAALAASTSTSTGHAADAPNWLPQDGPPATKITLDAWYDAFYPEANAHERATATSELDNLPAKIQEATLTLLWGQAKAHQHAQNVLQRLDKIEDPERLNAAIIGAIAGAHLNPDESRALRDHVRITNDFQNGIKHEPAAILAEATDRALALAEEHREDVGQDDPRLETPASHPASGPRPPEEDDIDPNELPDEGDIEEILPDEEEIEQAADELLETGEDPVDEDTTPNPEAPPGATNPSRDIWFEDPTGRILVTGFQETALSLRHVAAHLDLGGDDAWGHNAGGAQAPQDQRYAVMVDAGGDDTYETSAPFAQGGVRAQFLDTRDGALGLAPVGVLLDARGDDDYSGGPFSQGAALTSGTGMLVDRGGDDSYQVQGDWDPVHLDGLDISGGQGYAVSQIEDEQLPYLSADGVLVEGGGNDAYKTPKGLGAGLSVFHADAQLGTRQANGLVFERDGSDDYSCADALLCLGQGRYGENDVSAEQPGILDGRIDVNSDPADGPDELSAGVRIGVGSFTDTGGQDHYPKRLENPETEWRTRANNVVEYTSWIHFQSAADGVDSEAQLESRASLFVDLNAGDGDGDRYPDDIERTLGYSPGEEGDNPHDNVLDALNVTGLTFSGDADRDCWNDAFEQRLGTDEAENQSRPADHPGPECSSPPNGYLLDLRLDTTLGTGPTAPGSTSEDTSIGPTIGGNDLSLTASGGLGGSVGSDGRTIPLLALGDVTPTSYTEPYRVALDLGGDDEYDASVGAASKPFGGNATEGTRDGDSRGIAWNATLPGLAVDTQGDDVYDAPNEDPAFGSGLPGAYGVLVELAGDDRFSVEKGLGASLGLNAVGALVDLEGSDRREAKDLASLGYADPTCSDDARSYVNATHLCHPQAGGVAVPGGASAGVLVDARGRDEAIGLRGGFLAQGNTEGLSDAGSGNTQGLSNIDAGVDSVHAGPSLASYVDLEGADRYEIDDPGAVDYLHKTQGYAQPQLGEQDGGEAIGAEREGRIRGGAMFLDADGSDKYEARALDLELSDVSREKNDLLLTRGVHGLEDGDESPSIFWDARGPNDFARNPVAFAPETVDTISGTNSPDRDGQTVSASLDPFGYILEIPRLDVYVGGTGPDRFDQPARFALDLGGDDAYLAPVGAGFGHVMDRERPTMDAALALDLGGDDSYKMTVSNARGEGEGQAPDPAQDRGRFLAGTQGAGVLGTGVLASLGGANTFEATVDSGTLRSHSESRGEEDVLGVAQGAGFYGVGLLYTELAENSFTSRLQTDLSNAPTGLGLSQGAALSGLGLLVNDAPEGSDTYRVLVENATTGEEFLFEGDPPEDIRIAYSQGAIRNCEVWLDSQCYPAAGAAALIDRGGDDTYELKDPHSEAPYLDPTLHASQGSPPGLFVDLGGRDTLNGQRPATEGSEEQSGFRACQVGGGGAGDEAPGAAFHLSCPVQDNADRAVTIGLDPSSVRLVDEADGQDALQGGLVLDLTVNPPECDDGSVDVIRGKVCLEADVRGAASDGVVVEDYSFWIEQPDRSPVLIGHVEPAGDDSHVEVEWNATMPDDLGTFVTDGSAMLQAVARVSSAGGVNDAQEAPVMALRQNEPVEVNTPPRIDVGLSHADSEPQKDELWISEPENGETLKVAVSVTIHGETEGDELGYNLVLVPRSGDCSNIDLTPDENTTTPSGFSVDIVVGDTDGAIVPSTLCQTGYDLQAKVTEKNQDEDLEDLTGVGSAVFGYDAVPPGEEGELQLLGENGQRLQGMTQNLSTGGSGTFVVGWETADETSGIASDGVTLYSDDCGGEELENRQSPSGNITHEAAHDERYTICLEAQDQAGNTGTVTATTSVDLERPMLSLPSVSRTFVGATEQSNIAFSVNASEDGSLRTTEVLIDGEAYSLDRVGSDRADGRTEYEFAFDDWGAVLDDLMEKYNKTHPANLTRSEGYAYRFLIEDRAGNEAQTNERAVFVDGFAPVLSDVQVEYEDATAAGPGDLVRIHVDAADNFGVDEVVVNASGVSSSTKIPLVSEPGTGNHSGAVVLDGEITPPEETVTVSVQDLAGNLLQEHVPIRVVTEAVSVTQSNVTGIRAQNATVEWETDAPSRGTVHVASEATSETRAYPVETTGTNHVLALTDLDPYTRYQVTIVPANEAGDTAGSTRLSFTTESLIHVNLTEPEPGAVLSGPVELEWNVATPREGALTYTALFESDRGLIPVASTTGKPDEHKKLTVGTRDLLDDVYEVHLRATQGFDETVTTVEGVRVDNTPPQTRLINPLPGGAAPTGTVRLEGFVLDEGAGVVAESVHFLVDGDPIQPDTVENGSITATHTFPEEGTRHVAIQAADEAGNRNTDGGPVAVDDQLPHVVEATLAGDQSTVAPGAAVPVRATVNEDGLQGSLNASALGSDPLMPLHQSTDRLWGEFQVPDDAEDGAYTIYLEVEDDAGSVGRAPLPLVVDGTPPSLHDVTAEPLTPGSAIIVFQASEPATATATLTTDGAPQQGAETDAHQSNGEVTVSELLPGRTYTVELTAADRAGNLASQTTTFTTPPDDVPPSPVTGLEARVTAQGHVALTWQAAEDDVSLQGYDVHRVQPGGEEEHLAHTDETRWLDEHATSGGTYTYRVTSLDLGGNTAPQAAEVSAAPVVAPELSNGTVTPEEGPPGTSFTYTVDYSGPADPPPTVEVLINGHPRPMTGPSDMEKCREGCTFSYEEEMDVIKRTSGPHTFSYRATVGGFVDQLPQQGDAERGPIVSHGATQHDAVTGPMWAAGIGGILVTALAGLGVAFWRW